ncbi:class GN sortase [Sphingomonas rosea]|uniref:Class GN sortase n=1 Tax=Sphingomonas rosea TaxID=335605 RepID=A0ABP7U399_9SPHN
MRPATIALAGLTALGLFQAGQAAVIPVKAVVAEVLLERAFERSLAGHRPVKPWGWADMAPVARLTIPRLGFRTIILDKGSGQAMAFGPTVVAGTAVPGTRGTSVVAAHRDTHFRALRGIRVGDLVGVEDVAGRTSHFRVTATGVVRWDRFAVSPQRARPMLVLVTCFPFDSEVRGPDRFIVTAEPVT